MKKEKKEGLWVLWTVVLVGAAIFFGGQTLKAGEGGIHYKVAPSGKITKVTYYIAKFKGKETLFFEVGVKNISDQPKRFKVMVDIPNGPSAAYYYPIGGKPPALKAGEEHSQAMPLVIYNKWPTAFSIIVDEM